MVSKMAKRPHSVIQISDKSHPKLALQNSKWTKKLSPQLTIAGLTYYYGIIKL